MPNRRQFINAASVSLAAIAGAPELAASVQASQAATQGATTGGTSPDLIVINATIYMAVIGVYEILPAYTGRPWTISRPFLASWAAVTLIVMAVYPHHLLMDYAMPKWAAVTGQVLSYLSGIPILLVTAYGALVNIHRSGLKWDLPLRLLVT